MKPEDTECFRFDAYTLIPERRLLLEDGAPVRLGGRALDLLVELVRHGGTVVPKERLMSVAWPRAVVDEASLRVHIAALRKVLGSRARGGAHFIENKPGLGYRFVGEALRSLEPLAPSAGSKSIFTLPHRQTRMVGRETALEALRGELARHRFVSIVGPGGMGKSTLAVAIAENLAPEFTDGVRFVDLTALKDSAMVMDAVGAVLGVAPRSMSSTEGVSGRARDLHLLLVLDNCEHVAEGVAQVVFALLRGIPMVRVLATSREVLQAHEEVVHHLQCLALPAEGAAGTAAAAMRYSSIRLFVERAGAHQDFVLDDAQSETVAELCRRLDGLPLAIELAAAQVGPGGAAELLMRLSDPMGVLSSPGMGGNPRHRALLGVLESSHQRLSAVARLVLRRVSVFAGRFTLRALSAVICDDQLDADGAIEGVVELATKSLFSLDLQGDLMRYRLLETTRAFAAARLRDSMEEEKFKLRHADFVMEGLKEAALDWSAMAREDWMALHCALIDDVRVALDWASEAQNWRLAATLTAKAFPFGHQLSLLDEFRDRVERVLQPTSELQPPAPRLELTLLASLVALLGQTRGFTPAMITAQRRAGALSAQLPFDLADAEMWRAMWAGCFGVADYVQAMRHVECIERAAAERRDEPIMLVAQRMRAQTLHFMGCHRKAIELAHEVLRRLGPQDRPGGNSVHPVDPRISLRIVIARTHWLRGDPVAASAIAEEAVAFATAGVGYSLCQALGLAACPIAIWAGDVEKAALLSARLMAHASEHGLHQWRLWGENFQALLAGRSVSIHPQDYKQRDLFLVLTPGAFDAAEAEQVRARCAGWCEPEALRRAAELRSGACGGPDPTAWALLRRAMALARMQGAASWELRCALTWWRWRPWHGGSPVQDRLARICHSFGPTVSTPDLQEARRALSAVR